MEDGKNENQDVSLYDIPCVDRPANEDIMWLDEPTHKWLLQNVEDDDWDPDPKWLNTIFGHRDDVYVVLRKNLNNYLVYF